MIVTASLLAIALSLLVTWIWYRIQLFQTFKRLNIQGPKPSFIFGNLREFNEKGILNAFNGWYEKYGNVLGYYRGGKPVLLVGDTELIKQIQVKNFHSFSDRPRFPIPSSRSEFLSLLTSLRGERWRHVRGVLSPTFSAFKMRRMTSAMNLAVGKLMKKLAQHSSANQVFHMYNLYQAMTLEVIGHCAFGLDVNPQENDDDEFLDASRNTLSVDPSRNKFIITALLFPEFARVVGFFRDIVFRIRTFAGTQKRGGYWLMDKLTQVIAFRRETKYVGNDMVQLMLDASENREEEEEEKKVLKQRVKKLLSDDEIKGNAFIFLIAGYETTSTALAFTTYLLATHREVQEKLIEEIDANIADVEGDITYDMVNELPYLDAVINESLRLYPPAGIFVNRVSSQPMQVGSLHIPANMEVQIPVWSLHHDPKYWDNPNSFLPERFLDKSKSSQNNYVFQAFGVGPRNCIGMRFALMEVKIALASVLKKFRFETCSDTEVPLEVVVKTATISPSKEVTVKVLERE